MEGGWNWLTIVTNVRFGLSALGLWYQVVRWLVTNSVWQTVWRRNKQRICVKVNLGQADLFPVSLSVHKEIFFFIGMWVTLDPVESHDNPLCQFPCGSYLLAWSVTYATTWRHSALIDMRSVLSDQYWLSSTNRVPDNSPHFPFVQFKNQLAPTRDVCWSHSLPRTRKCM